MQRFNLSLKTLFLFLLILFIFATYSCNPQDKKNYPKITKGQIDVSSWNIENEPLKLEGEWEFYWNELIESNYQTANPADSLQFRKESQTHRKPIHYLKVPGSWAGIEYEGNTIGENGYLSYRLLLRNVKRYEELAIRIDYIASNYKLFQNGKLLANIGKVGKSEFDSSFSNLPKIISLTPTESGEIEIILHVSNFFLSNGGIFYNIYLGKLNYLEKMRENQLILDFFLFGSIGIMGFYHFGLFLLRRNDKSTLYFSIFCLLSSIRPFFVGERYISSLINPEFHIYLLKAEYLNVYMLAPFFLLFQVSLFKNDFSKLITRLLNTIFITFILLVIFTDSNLYTSTLSYWQILVLIVFLYILFCIFRAAFNKREGALPFLSGLLCVILASVNDILHVQEIIQTGYYFPIGLLVFIISQAYILSANFSNAFKQSEISREEAEMQKKLAQKREVEIKQLNKAKDEFLANLSHELKTPLTYIYMYSEILSTTNEKETVIGYSKDLLANSKKLKEYLEDLILITDLETNIQLNLEKKSLQELVRIELDKLNDLAKEKQVQIKLEIPKSIDVNVDKKIFGKAIYSILKNSIVFNKINGLISIGARFDEESIFLSITDTGIGIEKKYLDKIFDKFFRIDSSLSYKVSGVGIGLYLAKKTIELHQGHLTVLSELNIGSTFTIQIYRF